MNMPDFDLVIEIANYYDVSIEEILDGEKKTEMVDKKTEQILLKVANCESSNKQRFSGRVYGLFIAAIIAFILYSILDVIGLATKRVYAQIASYEIGLVLGALLVGALYTSWYMPKVQAFKQRLLVQDKRAESEYGRQWKGKSNTLKRRVVCQVCRLLVFLCKTCYTIL